MKITNKEQYFQLASQGLLDNTLRTWKSKEDASVSNCPRFVIRSRTGGEHRRYDVAREDLDQTVVGMVAKGADVRELIFSEWMFMDHFIIGGDVIMRQNNEIELTYTFDRAASIRETLASKEAKTATDFKAEAILWDYLDRDSYIRIINLMNVWRDHVIEFALFDYPSGMFNRPLIIFEIRCY